MNINNPTTFGSPSLTLSTSNSSGTGGALRADDTILVFDTTNPAAVAASAVVGSATVTARRDHVHPGIVGAGTVVDEAIARFDGTSGDSLQGYSSLSPTISDAGIITLTSGALKFPATAIASGNANTLDDFEVGTFTPTITFGGNAVSVVYTYQIGKYVRIGNVVTFAIRLTMSNKGSSEGAANILGLPFTAAGDTYPISAVMSTTSFADQSIAFVGPSSAGLDLQEIAADGTVTGLTEANFANNSSLKYTGLYYV